MFLSGSAHKLPHGFSLFIWNKNSGKTREEKKCKLLSCHTEILTGIKKKINVKVKKYKTEQIRIESKMTNSQQETTTNMWNKNQEKKKRRQSEREPICSVMSGFDRLSVNASPPDHHITPANAARVQTGSSMSRQLTLWRWTPPPDCTGLGHMTLCRSQPDICQTSVRLFVLSFSKHNTHRTCPNALQVSTGFHEQKMLLVQYKAAVFLIHRSHAEWFQTFLL